MNTVIRKISTTMDVKKRISDGISYIFKELNEAKTNDITQERRRFLLISLDLYLNALEYLVSNKQSDNTEIYINATEVNVDEIIKSIINKEEIYIGYNIPMLMLSLIHISEPTRRTPISYAVFCLKK